MLSLLAPSLKCLTRWLINLTLTSVTASLDVLKAMDFPFRVQSCTQVDDLEPTRTKTHIALELDLSSKKQINAHIAEYSKE